MQRSFGIDGRAHGHKGGDRDYPLAKNAAEFLELETLRPWREANVSLVYRFSALEDAHFFLNQAKGLPSVPSCKLLRERCIRASLLFSWVALEEALKYVVERRRLRRGSLPPGLKAKLESVLAAVGQAPMDPDAYSSARRTRNEITHPSIKEGDPTVTLKDAEQTFKFCSQMTQRLFKPHEVTWQVRTTPSAEVVRATVRLSSEY